MCYIANSAYQCTGSNQKAANTFSTGVYYEIFPGSPAVCGHGNREFSFLARRGADVTQLLIVFVTGGMCWDADSCGLDASLRTMAVDNLVDKAPAVPESFPVDLDIYESPFKRGILDPSQPSNPFKDWSVVVVPDCTGDSHAGNQSHTYAQNDPARCITVHHRGAVNAGMAVDWALRNFPAAARVLAVGTGPMPASKASGGFGAAFWAPYLQARLPGAAVRVLIDSALGLFGPLWKAQIAGDPWGTAKSLVPVPVPGAPAELLPPPAEWSIAEDDLSAYYEWAARTSPRLAFADATAVDEAVQRGVFALTGGLDRDCCLDGCACSFGVSGADSLPYSVRAGAPPYGLRGGQLDWTKTVRVTVLRRLTRLPSNYVAWLVNSAQLALQTSSGPAHFLLLDPGKVGTIAGAPGVCPNPLTPSGPGVPGCRLGAWAYNFSQGQITFGQDGSISGSVLSDARSFSDLAFGNYVCAGCLDGIPGTRPGEPADSCNATLGDAETLFSVAAAYGTDWVTLWSLNGGESPDSWAAGDRYRFAHEYSVRPGETLAAIAARFGTSSNALVDLNYNQITNIYNPLRVADGDVICVLPAWARTVDQLGENICRQQQ